MVFLQLNTFNPGKIILGTPHHVGLPDWLAISSFIVFTGFGLILYFQIRSEKKKVK